MRVGALWLIATGIMTVLLAFNFPAAVGLLTGSPGERIGAAVCEVNRLFERAA